MPRTSIPITDVGNQGSTNPISYTAADAANNMKFENTGRELLVVKNGGAGAVAVTVQSVTDEAGRTGNIVASVAAAADAFFGPFKSAWWNQRSGVDQGTIQVDFDIDTTVTVALFRVTLG